MIFVKGDLSSLPVTVHHPLQSPLQGTPEEGSLPIYEIGSPEESESGNLPPGLDQGYSELRHKAFHHRQFVGISDKLKWVLALHPRNLTYSKRVKCHLTQSRKLKPKTSNLLFLK